MMETKLTEITPIYSSFENDQVLTAGQLNEFLNYFDDQDRLTRISLTGVGIVCGFKLNFTDGQQLIVSQGCGVTTDGDLLKLQETIQDTDGLKRIDIDQILYTHYAEFTDDKALYKPFFYKPSGSGDVQIPLWEFLPSEAVPNNGPISALPELNKKVVLLYLESYNDDDNLCVGLSCDNQGILQVQNLRVLVVNEEDADYILSLDPLFNANSLLETYFSLSDVSVPRVIVNQQNTASFALLNQSFNAAITQNNTLSSLKSGFLSMLNKLNMSAEAAVINQLLDSLFTSAALPQNTLYFQYRYDLYKDVVDTYSELKELFLKGGCTCSPDIHSFPKHLMLGKLIPTADDIKLKRYRHGFYKSPVLCCEGDSFEQFRFLITRLIQQMSTYMKGQIPYNEIKITPSRYYSLLGEKAIPYYYNVQANLLQHWNFEKTQHGKQTRNLSYHRSLLSSDPAIQTPLLYNLEPFNFLRIEGHQGRNVQQVIVELDTIRETNGLAYDVKALGISVSPDDTINLNDYACEFADLQTILDAFVAENNCLLANASYYLSSYSLVQPGVNRRKAEYIYGEQKVKKAMSELGKVTPATEAGAAERVNPVESYLDPQDNSMGKVMKDVLDTYEGCSAQDIIAHVNLQLQQYDFREWNPVEYDATLGKPMEMLSYAYEYAEKLPHDLVELNPAVIQAYQLNAANVCSLAKQVQAVITGEIPPTPPPPYSGPATAPQSPDGETAGTVGGVAMRTAATGATGMSSMAVTAAALTQQQSMLLLLANQLADICCNTQKIKVIYDEIEARKAQIVLRLKLSEFVKAHPGLEHLAGTKQGGTFVLVFITNTMNGIPGQTVVADFTLPYSCCSDCLPINFIVPRPGVELYISKSTYCLGVDTEPLTFTSVPADGKVALEKDVPGVIVQGKQLFIDPDLLPAGAIGTPIFFKLNDTLTTCSVTIFKAPSVDFVVPQSPTTQTTIVFRPSVPAEDGATFLWNFGDGTGSTQKEVTHTYTLPVNPTNTVNVSLTITPADGSCANTAIKTIRFEETTDVTTTRVDQACQKEGVEHATQLLGLMKEVMAEELYGRYLTAAQQKAYVATSELLERVTKDSMSVLSGQMNEAFGTEISALLKATYNHIVKLSKDADMDAETRMYRLTAMARLYLVLLRLIQILINCQTGNLRDDKAIDALISLIELHVEGKGDDLPPVGTIKTSSQKQIVTAIKTILERVEKK